MLKRLLLSLLLLTAVLNATTPTQENVTELYVAMFARAPAATGLDYWVNDSDLDLEGITMSFFDQEETQLKYPPGTTPKEFITEIYKNLFNREPAEAGLKYWKKELESGSIPRSLLVLAVINGAQGTDVVILANKTAVGLAFAKAGLYDTDDAKCVMAGVTEDYATAAEGLKKVKGLLEGIPCTIEWTLQDYKDAGITGVTEKNLDEVNEAVNKEGLDPTDPNDQKEIQKIVDEINNPTPPIPPTPGNKPPVADAGPDQNDVAIGDTVQLDGSGSTDPDGDSLTYEWTMKTKPAGSAAALSSTTAKKPTFTADEYGSYTIELVVNDGKVDSNTASVTVTTVAAPVLSTLKKTGQTISYVDFDDGYYQAGVTPSYTRDGTKEVVTDNVTGLMWQDDAEAKTVVKNWADADAYCTALPLGSYDDWRLPTIVELHGIAVDAAFNPSIDTTAFVNYASNFYWSSTAYGTSTSNARIVSFYYGYTAYSPKYGTYHVRCVRAGQ